MKNIILSESTHNERADSALLALIGIFETAFGGRIRSFYLEGSYADQTEVTNSDLDIIIIFKDTFQDQQEYERAVQLGKFCALLSIIELDITLAKEADMVNGVRPLLKFGGRFLYGDDILPHLPVLPMEEWIRDRMHVSYWLMVKTFHRPLEVRWPLTYPDPDGEFYGYDQRKVRTQDGKERGSTRDLLRVTGWMATALIALKKRRYVSSKQECFTEYRHWIGDQWTELLEELYSLCRGQWRYLIPAKKEEREQLRALCARVLDWENHFLEVYKPLLLSDLRSKSADFRKRAIWLMSQIPYNDEEVRAALRESQDTAK